MLQCDLIIQDYLGREMTRQEKEELLREAKDIVRKARANANAADLAEEARKLAAQRASREAVKQAARRRNTQLQLAKRAEAVEHILREFKGMEAEGVTALLVGSVHAREGARLSCDARQSALKGYYIMGVMNEIRSSAGEGAWNMFKSGKIDQEIANALWCVEHPQNYKGLREAMEIAEVIHKWSEKARRDANEAGAYINKLDGFIVSQSHDPLKLAKAGEDEWVSFIRRKLDWTKTAEGKYDPAVDPKAADEFLREVFRNLETGVHMKAGESNPLTMSSVSGTTAAKLSHNRILHFESGDAWYLYNERFGNGHLGAAVLGGFEKLAKATGLMRTLGPSPRANLERIMGDIALALRRSGAGGEQIRKLTQASSNKIWNQYAAVDGTTDVGNPCAAQIGQIIRAHQSMIKLGGAVISGFSDIPTFAYEFAYQGKSFTASMLQGVKSALRGRGTVEQQKILSCLGVLFDTMSGDVCARFAGNNLPGKMNALQNVFFKLNGLGIWTDSFKKATGLMMAHDLASEAHLNWAALSMERKRSLSLYGIDEGIWEMTRKGKMMCADGRDYFTPEMARHITGADAKAYLEKQGYDFTMDNEVALIKKFRQDTEDRFRTYFRDRLQSAILEPDARTKATIYQGRASGTIVGEVLRCVMQFKSFSFVFMQRVLGREIFGRGDDTYLKGFSRIFNKSVYGDRSALPHIFLMTTLFGYLSMTVKALFANRTPRDPSEPKTWVAAMLQGGGLGIYGDFLFGEASRMGDSFLENLAGPALSSMSSVSRTYMEAKDGKDVTSQLYRFLYSNIPGNNLFWAKTAMDYAINYQIYENLNPGFVKRMRKKMAKDTNQEFIFDPVY